MTTAPLHLCWTPASGMHAPGAIRRSTSIAVDQGSDHPHRRASHRAPNRHTEVIATSAVVVFRVAPDTALAIVVGRTSPSSD